MKAIEGRKLRDIFWKVLKVIDWYTRKLKEAINITLHLNNINMDNGIEAWVPTFKKQTNMRQASGPLRKAERNNSRIETHQLDSYIMMKCALRLTPDATGIPFKNIVEPCLTED